MPRVGSYMKPCVWPWKSLYSDDLTCVVDAVGEGVGTQRIVERAEGAPAVEEAVHVVIGVTINSDGLTCVVDAAGKGAAGARWIEEGRVGTVAIEEPRCAVARISEIPDDLARVDVGN